RLAELATDLLTIEARGLERAEHERDVLLREVLGPVAGQGDLDSRAFVLDVPTHAALPTTEAVAEQPRFHRPSRDRSRHTQRATGQRNPASRSPCAGTVTVRVCVEGP